MIVEVRDGSCALVKTLEATPECGKDFCDTCGDCLACFECDCAWWILYTDMDVERIAELEADETTKEMPR
jgi:hypothetical protein